MPTTPPGYTPPPTDLPQRGDRATFSNRVDAWVTWFSTVILTQLAAIVANAYANALDAAASAASALGYRDAALTYQTGAQAARDAAQGYRDTALTYRDAAAASATAAAASATAAANSAASITATSPTDQTLGTGTFVFVTQAGKQFPVGADVKAVDQTNTGNAIYGTVAAYSGTSLTITGTSFTGSGLVSDWNIALSGQRGAQGPTGSLTGGNLTGALNFLLSTSVATATQPNIWNVGNIVPMTGGVTVDNFTAAPQAGATRTLRVVDGFTLSNNANIAAFGGTAALAAGDEVDILALTTTTFRAIVRRKDGTATVATTVYPAPRNQRIIPSTLVFTPDITGWYRVTVVGSGGRGGRAYGTTARATGGGAPGKSVKWFYLIAGTGYPFNIASGVANASASTSSNGADGFASTFTGPGSVVITANGGKGGVFSVGTVNVNLLGGLGGTATGGDINIPGGRGGDINVSGSTGTTSNMATGGGSVGALDVPYRGGDINITSAFSTSVLDLATGGAGVGGNGGDITFSPTAGAGTFRAASGSGGAGAAGASITAITSNVFAAGAGGANAGYEASSAQATYVWAFLAATAGGLIGKNNPGTTGANPDGASGAGGAAQVALATTGVPTAVAGFLAGGGGITIATPDSVQTGLGSRFGGPSGGFTAPVGGASAANGSTQGGFGLVEW